MVSLRGLLLSTFLPGSDSFFAGLAAGAVARRAAIRPAAELASSP
jgi:hypothetical protein